jgi:hypothetical protein
MATLCFVALLPSCTHWVVAPGPPGPNEEKVRVTTAAGEQVVLMEHSVDGSVFGGWLDGYEEYWTSPLDSVSTFEVRGISGGRTAVLVTTVAVAGLVAFAIIATREIGIGGAPPPYGGYDRH